MKRILTPILISLALGVFAVQASVQTKKKPPKKKPDCTAQHKPIKTPVDCPDDDTLAEKGIKACDENGCGGSVDKLLNQQKNTDKGNPDSFVDITFPEFAAMPKCVDGYTGIGDEREPLKKKGEGPLKKAGEGTMVRVVAWAVAARPQQSRKDENGDFKRGESCNCGFTGIVDVDGGPKNTDVHIVLVETPKKSEAQSQTAEYTPRVRAKLKERFDGFELKDAIANNDGKLLVRVTGLLMYDSEHAFELPLTRQSNWEIHPVFRLEFCRKKKTCTQGSDANWVDINK
jgi:hypothetical protein